jgi:hypothetical protein
MHNNSSSRKKKHSAAEHEPQDSSGSGAVKYAGPVLIMMFIMSRYFKMPQNEAVNTGRGAEPIDAIDAALDPAPGRQNDGLQLDCLPMAYIGTGI